MMLNTLLAEKKCQALYRNTLEKKKHFLLFNISVLQCTKKTHSNSTAACKKKRWQTDLCTQKGKRWKLKHFMVLLRNLDRYSIRISTQISSCSSKHSDGQIAVLLPKNRFSSKKKEKLRRVLSSLLPTFGNQNARGPM